MSRFTLPRDLYHGKGALETLKTLKGKRAIVCVGGGSMKRGGFLDRALAYLKEAGMETKVIEGIESDPSVETVMDGAAVMQEFQPDWIIAMGGGASTKLTASGGRIRRMFCPKYPKEYIEKIDQLCENKQEIAAWYTES